MRVPDRFNHEYWPWYLIYLPVFPAALWHALRSGHWAFFTNVNPSIDLGGFFGERKSEIYALLPSGSYPTTVLIEPGMVSHVIRTRMYEAGLELPLIAKPDVGERGEGVVRVNTAAELEALCRKWRKARVSTSCIVTTRWAACRRSASCPPAQRGTAGRAVQGRIT